MFGQNIGHIVGTRVAGNIATPEIVASVEHNCCAGRRLIVVWAIRDAKARQKRRVESKAFVAQVIICRRHLLIYFVNQDAPVHRKAKPCG
jgi:hypothetical protein